MWFEFFEGLGRAYAAYRAVHDAGIWFFQTDMPIFMNYMESFLVTKENK